MKRRVRNHPLVILLLASCLVPLLLSLTGCGGEASGGGFRLSAHAGGSERNENYSAVSLSSFTRFEEVTYDSLPTGFLGPPLWLGAKRYAIVTADRRLLFFHFNQPAASYPFEDGEQPLMELASDSAGTVYVTTAEGSLVAVDTAGSEVWRGQIERKADDSTASSIFLPLWPLTVPGGVLFGSTDGYLQFYRPDGELAWKKRYLTRLSRSIAWNEESGIIVGMTANNYTTNDTLLSLNPDGTERWKSGVEGRIECGPILVGDRIAVGLSTKGENGKYNPSVALYSSEGKLVWQKPLDILPVNLASDDNGNIYICGGGGGRLTGGVISSFGPEGEERWSVGLRQSAPSHLLISSGQVHFLSQFDNMVGVFTYTTEGTFSRVAPVESTATITTHPTILPDGRLIISSSDKPILLTSTRGSFF